MNNFLKVSGAIIIGIAAAATATFPILIIGAVIGWFWLDQETNSENQCEKETIDEEEFNISSVDFYLDHIARSRK